MQGFYYWSLKCNMSCDFCFNFSVSLILQNLVVIIKKAKSFILFSHFSGYEYDLVNFMLTE